MKRRPDFLTDIPNRIPIDGKEIRGVVGGPVIYDDDLRGGIGLTEDRM